MSLVSTDQVLSSLAVARRRSRSRNPATLRLNWRLLAALVVNLVLWALIVGAVVLSFRYFRL